mmetsp:Transcript_59286/g.170250  ORF Transcript_59286/g.170250 Transcript_59286/m.170250 type:complete len:231 (+) Transcript_59286:117-809(+)
MPSKEDVRSTNIEFTCGPQHFLSTTSRAHGGHLLLGGPHPEGGIPRFEGRSPSHGGSQTLGTGSMLGSSSKDQFLRSLSTGSLRISSAPGKSMCASMTMRTQQDREMRNTLKATNVHMGSHAAPMRSDYGANFPSYSKEQQKESQGMPDPALKEDLKKVHYSFGEDSQKTVTHPWYDTDYRRLERSHYNPQRQKSETWYAPRTGSFADLKASRSELRSTGGTVASFVSTR